MRCNSGIAFALVGLARAYNFNHGSFGPRSTIWIYDNEAFESEPQFAASLFKQSDGPSLMNQNLLECHMEHQNTFENSAEYLPLTQPGYNYLECEAPMADNFVDGEQYCLTVFINGEQADMSDVCMYYNQDEEPLGRYEDKFDQDRRVAKSPSESSRFRRDASAQPKVEGITPRSGSPLGNTYVTIYGQNLASKQIDLAGSQSESESEGENYVIWFEREHDGDFWKVPCTVDRMLTLHAEPLDGKDFIICETQPVPRFYRHYLRMTIDDGEILKGGHFDFYESSSPTADFFYPANSAPAIAAGQYDYEGEFYTRWFDTDNNEDGVEDESFMRHWTEDRAAFQHCQNPIGIEVYNTDNLRAYTNSANENADGLPQADFINAIQVNCHNGLLVLVKKLKRR